MKIVNPISSAFILSMSVVFNPALGDEVEKDTRVGLKNHEPNLIGYTYDSDDKEAFMDFKLSLEYPLANGPLSKLTKKPWYPDFLKKVCDNNVINHCYPYFSFTGRFGQYIGQRDSSPVIAKRFNPKLFLRFDIKGADYVNLEYAHESNGQRVSTLSSYNTLATDLDKPEHANDYISRGWDYYGFTYKRTFSKKSEDKGQGNNKVIGYLNVRKFIGGQLQGDIEEYYDWEPRRNITAREQVGGVSLLTKLENNSKPVFLVFNKVALIYETGTKSPTKYNTLILEMTTNSFGVPFMFWGRTGYNSDLAQYYKKVNSIGVAFELKS
ncbi:MAG: phospholipase A [Porticoccus sp.]|nr:phospholipase A [Porticoccus sp.]